MLTALSLCPYSKHALGSHEYIQYCRKFGVDIRLQLMEQKAVRGDLARTVRVCRGGGGQTVTRNMLRGPGAGERGCGGGNRLF